MIIWKILQTKRLIKSAIYDNKRIFNTVSVNYNVHNVDSPKRKAKKVNAEMHCLQTVKYDLFIIVKYCFNRLLF